MVSPTLAETISVGKYARKWVRPVPSGLNEHYRTTRKQRTDGINFNADDAVNRLRSWRANPRYADVYKALRADKSINTTGDDQLIHNGFYPTPDAEVYASMIMDVQPQQIIEVGSGFSTLIARKALTTSGVAAKITVVDPEPRTSVRGAADVIINQFVENSALHEKIDWSKKTILFIDSSHVCRSRGDVPYLFCDLIPNLPAGITIHVHDIFLPYDYPTNYDQFLYTEQYVLHALLSHTLRYRVMMPTQLLSCDYTSEVQATFGPRAGAEPMYAGASFWFEIV